MTRHSIGADPGGVKEIPEANPMLVLILLGVSLMRYRLLFFDLDGTLADTAPDIAASVQRVFRARGLEPPSREKVVRSIGDGVSTLI